MEQLNIFDYLNSDSPEKPENLGGGGRHFERAHCLFEQSGTFKNEFIKLGIPAKDYDILNDFGETDCVVDLFAEIESAYDGNPSIFDDFTQRDVIMAFFPCTRFENQVMLLFRGQNKSQKSWTITRKMEYCMKLQDELTRNYKVVNKLFLICIKRGLNLVVENPFSQEHFLRRYWCYAPSIIDRNRTENGDFFVKPTQYWFVNFKPSGNRLEPLNTENFVAIKDAIRRLNNGKMQEITGVKTKSVRVARSMIHPQYANRFIRRYIL